MIVFLGWLVAFALAVVLVAILRQWQYEFTTEPIRFPRTWVGWRKAFWLFLRRCPVHHAPLRDGYGFCCDGVSVWPNFIEALRLNARAAGRETPTEGR